MLNFIVLVSFFPFLIFAQISKVKLMESKKIAFEPKEVCKDLKYRHLLLVEIVNSHQIDCMGKKVDVQNYCRKKFANNPKFSRGYVDKKSKKVICQMANAILLSLKCINNYKKLCLNHKKSCINLGKIFAYNLNMYHSFISRDRELQCHFLAKI